MPPARAHRLPRACALVLCLPAAAWADGGVMVRSEPPGQRIFVDGEETGLVTPALVLGLPAGRHAFELTSGCLGGAGEVEVIDGKNVELSITADQRTGLLKVSPNPPTAAVAIDGADGPNARALTCGPHTVRVALPGFVQAVLPVEIEAGRTQTLPVDLEPLGTGALVLAVQPPDAAVKIDGRAIGRGSLSQPQLTAGPHALELSAEGYATLQQNIVLEPGAELRLELALRPLPAPTPAPTPKPAGGMSRAQALRATGWGLTAVGVGAAVFGATRFAAAGAAYAEYEDRSLNGPGPAAAVEAIRADQVVPARNLGWTMTGLGAALVGGGVTLAIAF